MSETNSEHTVDEEEEEELDELEFEDPEDERNNDEVRERCSRKPWPPARTRCLVWPPLRSKPSSSPASATPHGNRPPTRLRRSSTQLSPVADWMCSRTDWSTPSLGSQMAMPGGQGSRSLRPCAA